MKNKIFLLLILVMIAGLLISCANLPTKYVEEATPVPAETDAAPEGEDAENTDEAAGDDVIIRHEWNGPDEGPTVTPIVLPVEKRGQEAAAIVRAEQPPSVAIPSGTGAQPAPVAPVGMKDEMEVVGFNPVSGAIVLPNQALHLDITLRNTGTTTWMTDYRIVDITEIPMVIDKTHYLPYPVAPGGTVVVSIYMTAPQNLGSYPENFQIEDAYGVVFGKFDYILTVGGFSSITEIPTLTATVTPTYYSAEGITATPDVLWWMCSDPERSLLQDCYSFCAEYSDRPEFEYCFYDGQRYTTPVP